MQTIKSHNSLALENYNKLLIFHAPNMMLAAQ